MKRILFLILFLTSFVYGQRDNFNRAALKTEVKWVNMTGSTDTVEIFNSTVIQGQAASNGSYGRIAFDSLFKATDGYKIKYVLTQQVNPAYQTYIGIRANQKTYDVNLQSVGVRWYLPTSGLSYASFVYRSGLTWNQTGFDASFTATVGDTLVVESKGDTVKAYQNSTLLGTIYFEYYNPVGGGYHYLELPTSTQKLRLDNFILNTGSSGTPALSAPVLVSPTDGVDSVNFTHTHLWRTATGATNYRFILGNSSFTTNIWDTTQGSSDTSIVVDSVRFPTSFAGTTSYYWKVMASNDTNSSPFSLAWSFITRPAPPTDYCTGDLTAPTIISTSANQTPTTFVVTPTISASDLCGIKTVQLDTGQIGSFTFYQLISYDAKQTSVTGLTFNTFVFQSGTKSYRFTARDSANNSTEQILTKTYSPTINHLGWVTAYYSNSDLYVYKPENINYKPLTHIIAFSYNVVTSTSPYFSGVVGTDSVTWNQYGTEDSLITVAHRNGVKVLACLGGIYGQGAADMAWVAADSTRCQTYANSATAYLKRRGYDGADLDWEQYIVKADYSRFLRIFRRIFNTWSPAGIFSTAAGYTPGSDFDVVQMAANLDQVNIMTYDYNQGNKTFFNSPLTQPTAWSPAFTETNGWAMDDHGPPQWLAAGFPKEKLAIALPFYTSLNIGNDRYNQTTVSNRVFRYYYQALDAKRIYSSDPTYAEGFDLEAKCSWFGYTAGGTKYFWSYDDSAAFYWKFKYIDSLQLGGVMLFDLGSGYLRDAYGGDKTDRQPLLTAVESYTGTTVVVDTPTVPVLFSPSNNATGQNDTLQLIWNNSTGASTYRLQVASDTAMSNIFYNDSTLTLTSRTISSLVAGTKYFWRVNAKNLVGTSDYSTIWSFTVQGLSDSAPDPPVLKTPINGAVSQSITPTLIWYKSTGATSYDFWVSKDSIFSSDSLVAHSSTGDTSRLLNSSVLGVAELAQNKTYYWRVSATAGLYTSGYADTLHFTTSGLPPGIPTLISPVDSATGVLTTASLVWGAVTDAIEYQLQLDTSATMASKTILLNTIVTAPTSSYQPLGILLQGIKYYWSVRTRTLSGWSAFSDTNSFTVLAIPSAPTLIYPANAQIDLPLSFNYRWNTVSIATGYTFQVSTSSTFANITGGVLLNDTTLSVANSTAIMSENTTYYWRVSSRNSSGASAWSMFVPATQTYYSFTTTTTAVVPSIPTLVTPANAAVNQDLAITSKWNKISDATSYTFQLSSNNFADTIETDVITAPDTSFVIGDLDYSTTYYWRVKATNTVGSSAYASRTFTTKSTPVAVPTAPILALPIVNAIAQDTSLAFVWGAVSGATSYQIQVSTSATYATTVLNQSGVTANTYTLSGLAYGTHYYWRVRATNTAGSSTWSSREFYTTAVVLAVDYIYSDSLETGWTNNSFRTQIEFDSDTSWTGYGIKAFSQKQGIVRFQHNSLATTSYDSLIMSIKPKKIGMFKIYFKGTLGFPVTNKTLTINVWNRITIPIATLNPRDQSVTNICIQNVRPDALVYYIDEVYFK